MFRRIVIPIDGSVRADAAIHVARHLAKRVGASMTLVRVESDSRHRADVEAIRLHARQELEQLRQRGLDAEVRTEIGEPREGILAAAEAVHADLLVLAPRRRGMLQRAVQRGVTDDLLMHAGAPILVLPDIGRGEPARPMRLLGSGAGLVICGLDGSDVAERSLSLAAGLARLYDRTLVLVRVVKPAEGFGSGPEAYQLLRQAKRDEELAAISYLRDMRRHLLRDTGLLVQNMLLIGDPATELLMLSAAHADSILVVSTHGRGGLSRVLLGSVAAEVIHRGTVPVFVMPPAARVDSGVDSGASDISVVPGAIPTQPAGQSPA
jgi:nucleotide-binding universal stress UspA family protein